MSKLTLKWTIGVIDEAKEERYCHNCSKKVVFADSMKRRRNANGKTIFEFAIYKCERGHTWNKLLNTSKANSDLNIVIEEEILEIPECEAPKELLVSEAIRSGIQEIEIIVKDIKGRQRVDKLLALYVLDLSRTQIKQWIDSGRIQIDSGNVKPDTLIRNQQIIIIKL